MFKIYYFQEPSSFNWLGLISIIISCISIFCTFYFIFLTKRAELRKTKFEKFCLAPLDDAFSKLDDLFQRSVYINIYKQNITDGFLDIQLLLITLKNVYPNIPVEKIVLLIESFTDSVYNSSTASKTDDLKADYLSTRILIYNEYFKFAITNEMVLLKRFRSKS